ncbi:MAG: metallophosphoesterase family protein [Akkermansia sp.]|nr:metallophosphoesterase family protein [Akkermansia sp.]
MLIALFSDIHDHTTHLLLAVHAAKSRGCAHILFMGDMVSSSTFRILREEWTGGIDLVLGNNECEHDTFQHMAGQWPQTRFHHYLGNIIMDGRKLFFTHLPRDAAKAAGSGKYDAVFFGHTHQAEVLQVGSTTVANPGEIYGRQSSPTIGIYNTSSNTVEIIRI